MLAELLAGRRTPSVFRGREMTLASMNAELRSRDKFYASDQGAVLDWRTDGTLGLSAGAEADVLANTALVTFRQLAASGLEVDTEVTEQYERIVTLLARDSDS